MKIAVAAMGTQVAGHFGHCENFIFFDTADDNTFDKIFLEERIHNQNWKCSHNCNGHFDTSRWKCNALCQCSS